MNVVCEETKATSAQQEAVCDDILLPGESQLPLKARRHANPQTVALVVIAIGVVLYGLYTAKAIAFPLTLALFIAFPLRPIMRWLDTRHIPRFIAASLVFGVFLAAVTACIMFLKAPATRWIDNAPQTLEKAESKLRTIYQPLEEINEASKKVEKMADGPGESGAVKVELQQTKLANTMMSTIGGVAMSGMIAVGLAFLLLIFGDDMLTSIVKVLPTRKDRRQLEKICFDVEKTISRYLLTYTLINIGLGAVIGFGLWIIGMPNPVLWGVMAALLNYIPFIGLIAGTGIVFAVALLTFDSTTYALLAPLIYLGANGIEANVITPTLLGKSMQLSTIMIFVAIVVFGWMWGIGGAIIAVPLLAVGKIVCDRSENLSSVSTVLTG